MRQAEIEISNEDIFRFRFSEISKTASNRLAFLAGSGEYGTFNLRYLIQQLVEQCGDMHKYTRKLEKYVVKLQRQVEDLEAEQRAGRSQRDQQGGGSSGPRGGAHTYPQNPMTASNPHNQGSKRFRSPQPGSMEAAGASAAAADHDDE